MDVVITFITGEPDNKLQSKWETCRDLILGFLVFVYVFFAFNHGIPVKQDLHCVPLLNCSKTAVGRSDAKQIFDCLGMPGPLTMNISTAYNPYIGDRCETKIRREIRWTPLLLLAPFLILFLRRKWFSICSRRKACILERFSKVKFRHARDLWTRYQNSKKPQYTIDGLGEAMNTAAVAELAAESDGGIVHDMIQESQHGSLSFFGHNVLRNVITCLFISGPSFAWLFYFLKSFYDDNLNWSHFKCENPGVSFEWKNAYVYCSLSGCSAQYLMYAVVCCYFLLEFLFTFLDGISKIRIWIASDSHSLVTHGAESDEGRVQRYLAYLLKCRCDPETTPCPVSDNAKLPESGDNLSKSAKSTSDRRVTHSTSVVDGGGDADAFLPLPLEDIRENRSAYLSQTPFELHSAPGIWRSLHYGQKKCIEITWCGFDYPKM